MDAEALTAGATQMQNRLLEDGPLAATFEEGSELPTKDHPQLAMVLIPSGTQQSAVAGDASVDSPGAPAPDSVEPTTGATDAASTDEPWVFPFDQPLPPEQGDNQALAVVTEDDSVVYDVAFALVWADGTEVLNVNEAHAYASCSNCVAVAVAFQVVLVMDGAKVVVPQNLAVSANYDCYLCITAAIASQLVLSVSGEPGEEELLALSEVWNRILEFATEITSYSVTEIMEQLESFQSEIVSILGEVPVLTPSGSATDPPDEDGTTPSTTAEPTSPTAPGTTGPSPSGVPTSTEPSPSAAPTGSASPEPTEPTPSATPSATEAPTDSPTPSQGSSPPESPSESSTDSSTPSPTESTSPITLATESPSASVSP